MNLFVYGTLMIPEIWHQLTRENNPRDKASLDGFFRSKLKGEVYPGIYKKKGRSVDGMIYYDLSPSAAKKLDMFEGERYRRVKVRVDVNGKSVQAETYALSENFHKLITDEEWNFEEFIRSGSEHFKNNYFGFRIIADLNTRKT